MLSEAPYAGSQGGDYDFVELRLKGYKDEYGFSKCSLNDRIQNEVCKMTTGDSVYLYVQKTWSTKSITLKPNPPKSNRICEARSPMFGYFIKFSRFNNCTHWKKNTFFPFLSGFVVLLGLVGLIRVFRKE